MKTFLMCEPRYFEVSYVINPWMTANIGRVNKLLARKQWQALHDALAEKSNIKLIEPVNGLPDMVFTANAGLVSHRHEVIVSTFRHPERQGESAYFRTYFQHANYRLISLSQNIKFEGAGDALFDSGGELWLAAGPRSDKAAISDIASSLGMRVYALTLVDPRWYHLDTAFCPLSDGYVIAYEKAFSAESANTIRQKFGEKAIWISDEDACNFACNAICTDHEIILHRASSELQSTLRKLGYRVIEIDVSEFIKAGGSCKCMTLEI